MRPGALPRRKYLPRLFHSVHSPYNRDTVMFLCIIGFLGLSGLHRFYVGRWKGGVLFLLTGGLFGIGTIIDLVKICQNKFEDEDGLLIRS